MNPKTLLHDWIDAFNAADADRLAALYRLDAVNDQVPEEPVHGRDAIREMFLREFERAKMVCIPENLFEDGEWAILEWRDPKGLRGCGFFHVQDGLIRYQRGYWDKLSFLRQHELPSPIQQKGTKLLINVDVSDIEKATNFYCKALGLSLVRRLFDGTIAEMAGAPCPVFLIEKPAGSAATSSGGGGRDYSRHWTPVHLDVEVKNIESARERCVAAGASAEGPIRADTWGSIATMSDPFGNGFCLVEFSEQGYDAVE